MTCMLTEISVVKKLFSEYECLPAYKRSVMTVMNVAPPHHFRCSVFLTVDMGICLSQNTGWEPPSFDRNASSETMASPLLKKLDQANLFHGRVLCGAVIIILQKVNQTGSVTRGQ